MSDLDLDRPFLRAAAEHAGISYGVLRGPRFTTVFRGVHVAADVVQDLTTRARAAVLLHPWSSFLSHETAASLQRLPVPLTPDVHLTVTRKSDRRPRPGLRTHVGAAREVVEVDGLRMSHGVQLFLELCAHLSLVHLVAVGDAMVRRGMVSPGSLVAGVRRAGGSALARRAAAYVSARVDSAMESRVRMLLLLAGFPPPLVNATVEGVGVSYRPDLCWPDLRLIVEYDGRHHRADLDQWDHDITRREWFEAHGWVVITLVARDVFQRPDDALRRITEAWLRCGGARFTPTDEWRQHFEVRRAA